MSRMTLEEIKKPITMRCSRCGGEATAYAYPMPRGSLFCPACSPAWLESFLKFATSNIHTENGKVV